MKRFNNNSAGLKGVKFYTRFFSSESVDDSASVKFLNEGADIIVKSFKEGNKTPAECLPLLGTLKYRALQIGVVESLTGEELIKVFEVVHQRDSFRKETFELMFDLLSVYINTAIKEEVYYVIKESHKDDRLRDALRSIGVDWFARALQLEVVYNPDGVLELFNRHYGESTHREIRTRTPMSFVSRILPHVYKDSSKLSALMQAEPYFDAYLPAVEADSSYALPILLADRRAGRHGNLYNYIEGPEPLRYVSSDVVQMVKTVTVEDLGMHPELPFKMHFELLKIFLDEEAEKKSIS